MNYTISYRAARAALVRRVAAPYKLRIKKIRADFAGGYYPPLQHTFITLSVSERNPSVAPRQLPYRGAEKQANEVRPYGRQDKYLQRFRAACAASVRRVAAPYETASNKFVDFSPLPHKSPQYSIFILLILYMVISINQHLYINYDMSFSALLSLRR